MSVEEGRQLRVLHVLEAIRGGTSRHVVDVVRAIPEVRHHIAVPAAGRAAPASGALADTAALEELLRAGAFIHPLEMQRNPLHPANLTAVWKVRGLIRTIRPDVVHGHSSVGGAIARIAAVGATPSFYTPNGLPPDRTARLVERMLGRLSDTFVAVSASEGALAKELKLAPPGRVEVVPNGIDLELPPGNGLDLRTVAGLPRSARIVGTVARLVPQKAPLVFVEVCTRVAKVHPDVHFVLIGLGPLQQAVDRAVAEAGLLGRWHQIPHVPKAPEAIAQMDVFALLSSFEGGPYTPLEAMRAGVPVVLSDVVGNRDVVEPGVSGFIAPIEDVEALARSVNRILEDDDLARTLAAEGRRRLEGRFDLTTMGDALLRLYRRSAATS